MTDREMIERMIANDEGGWVFTDYDKPTFAGVTLETFREVYPSASVESLKRATADEIVTVYRSRFLDRLFYCPRFLLPAVFSACVNMGMRGGSLLLQKTINHLGVNVAEDGIVGPKTQAAIVALTAAHGRDAVIAAFVMAWMEQYRRKSNSRAMRKFVRGWCNRARRYLPGPD